MRATDLVSEYAARGKVGTSGPIRLGNLYKDDWPVVKTPISHLYEVRIDNNSKNYPEYYFYNKETGACVGQFALDTLSDAADHASAVVKPGVMIVNPHITLAPEVQGKGLGLLIYRTFLADGNRVFATYGHSTGAGALWNKVATGDIISVLYSADTKKVVDPTSKESQYAVRILGHKNKFSLEAKLSVQLASKQGQNVWEQDELDEGWKEWLAGGALALGAMGAQAATIVSQVVNPGDTVYSIARQNNVPAAVLYKLNGFNNSTKLTPGQQIKVPDVYTKDATPTAKAPVAAPAIAKKVQRSHPKLAAKTQPNAGKVAPITNNRAEQLLMNTARRSGITGTELAAFMAQMAHESHDFKTMVEYGGSLDFRKYDPKYAPKKAKILGNTKAGDGARYKGRGFIQITGRYNYGIASKAIGIDLVKNPKLAENPAIAAKIAVWYWKLRVQPNVTNFNDVEAVTKPINPGMRGLEDRKENFADYITAMSTVDKAV